MNKNPLGNSDLQVSPLCFGGNIFGWTVDETTSFRLLDAFLDAGGNFIDTADVYSVWVPGNKGGDSETIIGKWLKQSGKREQIVIATKVGMKMAPGKQGLSAAHIRSSAEDSLKRLQTDRIDLYQSHEDDLQTPLEETLGAYAELMKAGKIRAIGSSNYKAARLSEALDVSKRTGLPAYQTLQPQYNLYDRAGYEAELESVAVRNGLGVIPYFSLAAGFLTGKYRSEKDSEGKARGGRVKAYLNDRGFRILEALDSVASEYRTKPAAVALAWLLTRPGITAPIASATSIEQLKDLLSSLDLKLDPSSVERLNQASAYRAAAS